MSQSTQPLFGRLIPAMVTPFDDELHVDIAQTRALARRLVDGGCDSLLIFGTTGEGPTVCADTKIDVLGALVADQSLTVPIIANVGNNCTADTIAFARRAKEVGVDGLMAVVPYYNKPPQTGLFAHFSALANAVDLPIILYNIPGRCGINMEAETTLALAREHHNIVAVKEASGNLEQIAQITAGAPDHFTVYSGDDALTVDVMKRGGAGVISTIANVTPARMKKIVEYAAQGLWTEAVAENENLLPLMRGLFATSNPILVKEALNLSGFNVGGVRLPLLRATREESAALAQVMRSVGLSV